MKYGYYTSLEIKQLLTSQGKILGIEEEQSKFQTIFNVKKIKDKVSFGPKIEKSSNIVSDIFCQYVQN